MELESEGDEETEKTPKGVKSYLKEQIKGLKGVSSADSQKEITEFEATIKTIEAKEKVAIQKESKTLATVSESWLAGWRGTRICRS